MSLSQTERSATRPTTAGTADSDTKSITFYAGTVGDEQSDYTIKYAGTQAVDWTYYYYGANKDKAGATTNTAMKLSQTERSATRPAAAGSADSDTKSVT